MNLWEKRNCAGRYFFCSLLVLLSVFLLGSVRVEPGYGKISSAELVRIRCAEAAASFSMVQRDRSGYIALLKKNPELAVRINCAGLRRLER